MSVRTSGRCRACSSARSRSKSSGVTTRRRRATTRHFGTFGSRVTAHGLLATTLVATACLKRLLSIAWYLTTDRADSRDPLAFLTQDCTATGVIRHIGTSPNSGRKWQSR